MRQNQVEAKDETAPDHLLGFDHYYHKHDLVRMQCMVRIASFLKSGS